MPEAPDYLIVPVHGPRDERIDCISHHVVEGDRVALARIGATFQVIEVPGHTRAHIAYYGEKVLFCGDTLFACGCGRMFEGTPPQMHASLQKLAALPAGTRFYCAQPEVIAAAAARLGRAPANPAETFGAIREWKNNF